MERLIVETLTLHGQIVESRHVFDNGRATIGRSYLNDIIIDDFYVSLQHIEIFRQDKEIHLKDLASENGTQINENQMIQDKTVQIKSGDIIRIGRTRLKLLLPDHPLEPTKQFDTFVAFREFIDRSWVPFVFTLSLIGLAVWLGYRENPSDKFWQEGFHKTLVGFSMSILSYAGLLSLYTFFKYKKSYFVRNLVISTIGVFLGLIQREVNPFLFFWILNETWVVFLNSVIEFFILLGVFWICVRMVKDLRGWRDVMLLAWIPLALVLLSGIDSKSINLGFQDHPVYHSKLAPGMGPIFKPISLDEFLEQGSHEFDSLPES